MTQEKKKPEYTCMKCGSHTIYLSITPTDLKGTLTCFKCGGTEDAAIGIMKDGKEIRTWADPSITRYLKGKKEREDASI